ncbi:hypothetical protein SLA2020_013270 [Shorea laevis]
MKNSNSNRWLIPHYALSQSSANCSSMLSCHLQSKHRKSRYCSRTAYQHHSRQRSSRIVCHIRLEARDKKLGVFFFTFEF